MIIKKQIYKDHPQIAIIEDCLDKAMRNESLIPPHCLNIWGMSGMQYRRFINNYMRSIPNPRYLEIGSYTGSTLSAAVGGIDNMQALAVDNFSLGGSSKDACESNVNQVKGNNTDIKVMSQRFEDFDFAGHGKFNVYMYDAEHYEHDQKNAITRCIPALEEISLIIVDDWNDLNGVTTQVKTGTYAGFAETNLEILFKWEVETGKNGPIGSDWHNGYALFLVRNPN